MKFETRMLNPKLETLNSKKFQCPYLPAPVPTEDGAGRQSIKLTTP
jgi:hypothetical protein